MSEIERLFTKIEETENEWQGELPESEAEKYLIFLSDEIFYGVNADCVAEIITETAVTWLPMLPTHIRGVINLRGQIVPIVDFRLLLGRYPGSNGCIIVLDLQETKIGILVDTVDQMVDIEKEAILPVPSQSVQAGQKMISGMYSLPGGGTMMAVDCSLLLHDERE